MALVLEATAKPLEYASRYKVNDALHSIQDVLNVVELARLDTTTMFDDIILTRSAEDLVCLLDFGLRKKDERTKRFDSGSYTEEDLAELWQRPA